MVAAAAVGGLATAGSAAYSANQAKKGAKAQVEAGDRASALEQQSADKQLALQREIWEKQQADYKPYLEQGQYGINTLGALMRPNADTSAILKNDPSYQFRLKQGQQALDRSSAARGMGYSGAQMKAAQEYGQGMASQQYDKEYNRASGEFGDYYNRLAGLAQGGQQATTSLQNAGSQYAQNAGNTFANLSNAQTSILGQQANARASGYAAKANAFNQGLGNMIDIYGISKKYG